MTSLALALRPRCVLCRKWVVAPKVRVGPGWAHVKCFGDKRDEAGRSGDSE